MAELKKELTLYGLTMVAVGSCIGSGIFVTPGQIARVLPDPVWILVVWGLGGLIALCGALTFGELGGMFPQAGGVYVFLKESYGEATGFLYGWIYLLVVNTGALAALSLAFADYLRYIFPINETMMLVIAVLTISCLTAMNMFGVWLGQKFINLFTGLKLLAIGGIVLAAFFYSGESGVQQEFSLLTAPDNLGSALLLAMIGVFWSFGGWHHASFLAAETVDAPKTVPRAMVIGTLTVALTYILVNLAYMLLLPVEAIAASDRVAGEAIGSIIPNGGKIVSVIIAISIFGTIGIYTMSAPRVYYAMAKDGIFFKSLAFIHPKFRTPVFAMAIQAVWAIILLVLWKTFEDLITYVTFMDLLFMMLAGISIFIFRLKFPNKFRLYKTTAYPFVPAIFILVTGAFLVNTLIQRPEQAIAGLIIAALGLIVYWTIKRYQKSKQSL